MYIEMQKALGRGRAYGLDALADRTTSARAGIEASIYRRGTGSPSPSSGVGLACAGRDASLLIFFPSAAYIGRPASPREDPNVG